MLNRRTFLHRSALAGASVFVPFELGGCARSSAPANDSDLVLTANIDGTVVDRGQVLEWEARRLQVVASRMNGNVALSKIQDLSALIERPAADTSNIVQERNLLADTKIKAGDEVMKQLIASDLLLSQPAMDLAASVPGYSLSQIDIFSNQGTAEGFTSWFTDHGIVMDDERSMLLACPDHYVLRTVSPNGQNVYEETGGALLVSNIVVNYSDTAGLPIVTEPDFPFRLSGAASSADGMVVGGVNHRFKNLNQGFQARVGVFFPASLPFWFVAEHRWHLACEFSNWITAYIDDTGP